MSKLFKELTGRTGLRGFRRDGFGSHNQGRLGKHQARSINLSSWHPVLLLHEHTSVINLCIPENPETRGRSRGQIPAFQTHYLFLGTSMEGIKDGPNAEHGLKHLKFMSWRMVSLMCFWVSFSQSCSPPRSRVHIICLWNLLNAWCYATKCSILCAEHISDGLWTLP